jgi:predicted Zn-dependent protease
VPDWQVILQTQLARIENPDRKGRFEFVMPALSADPAVREKWFLSLKDVSNRRREPWVLEGLGYLHHPLRASSSEKFVQPSLDLLWEIQKTGDIFFPKRWLDATLGGYQSQAVANKKGLFAYARATSASFTTTVRTPDGTGSGWASAGDNDWTRVNVVDAGERAIRKAEASRNPRAVEPGEWTVILEPTAVANLVNLMVFAMNARNADEGRSFFSKQGGGNKIGEKFLDERITITSDPADPRTAGNPFTGEGLPNRAMTWVENGTLRNLIYNRFWAQRNNREPTGFPGAYMMSGGNSTVDEMIRSTDRGLLVTRLWYIRSVDPRTILFTGLTRDGTFLIENGRITTAVKNLRWNESPIFMLNNIEAMSEPVRVNASEDGAGVSVMVPAIKSRDFTFTSLSDAV